MDGFIGEIRMFPWNWAPQGWLPANGQLINLQQYQALAAVIGFTYGGDGRSTIGLPNLQCCAPIGQGTGPGLTPRSLGPTPLGASNVTLSPNSMPNHTHALNIAASSRGAPGKLTAIPTATAMPANEITSITTFSNAPADSTMPVQALGPAGSGLPHANAQPYLAVQFCICFDGVFPVRP